MERISNQYNVKKKLKGVVIELKAYRYHMCIFGLVKKYKLIVNYLQRWTEI
jgi:hypothetical protein